MLLDAEGAIKIADFGLSRLQHSFERPLSNEVVTLWYRSPELLLGCVHYSGKVDTWACGCILAELLTLKPLFSGNTEVEQLQDIFRVLGAPTRENWPSFEQEFSVGAKFPVREVVTLEKTLEGCDEQGVDLVRHLLRYEPARRYSAIEALNHPFFDEYR